ncbi:MAG: acetolactate decarboxylase [Firmicutes bacterium]|nr:acetolactate decarboxylase [Bacillota bacterium]
MKRKRVVSVLLWIIVFFLPFTSLGDGALYHVSPLQALMQGDYYGATPLETLLQRGDTGLGTFDALDGEMVVLDGVVYRAAYDGSIHVMGNEVQTPFANVAFIGNGQSADGSFEGGYDALLAALNLLVPDQNLPVLFRIAGSYENVRVRSVPRQTEPYPPLTEAVKNQAVFDIGRVQGVIVGFRFPQYMGDINTTGYHLHFLSDDLRFGGHLLDAGAGTFTVRFAELNEFTMVLPDTISRFNPAQTTAADVEAVEQH